MTPADHASLLGTADGPVRGGSGLPSEQGARLWPLRRLMPVALVVVTATPGLVGCTAGDDEARLSGRLLYLDNCAPCHGVDGDGHGPQSDPLDPPPRDHRDPAWRASVTPHEVREVIELGVAGTSMPAWDLLSEQQLEDLTSYVLSIAEEGAYVEGES